ncbi:MAG TPA: nitrogenase component 1 [Methylomusa anaerophila]|uniref:Nitrogenase molybdenum-iron protein alpha chain n=1 Tax=Methylomusa anaerophila TaxID=1930071 RepID=A0A348AEP8_9FIRM|nr:nitrogenase component 1 [Methylomusa anaerophila]BBB89546.1 nitrogenase molybdenum-iron protein alpha chain [Methylomusa anaerophila]HML90086.1 nitrogenase component 1 [Methylomusa anaerophila]
MSVNLKGPAVELRESRLNTITGYEGDAARLIQCRNLSNRERSFTQCGSCGADQVMNLLSQIQDAAVVEHGPAGCASDISFRNGVFRTGNRRLGYKVHNIKYINTNLDENDTIYGGEAKLTKAIREAFRRFNPKAIFVTTTCASAIIGDDVPTICDTLETELGIPVIATLCEGFRTNIWATGFDSANHSILRKIVKPAKQKQPDLINVISFEHYFLYQSVFEQLGLRPNHIVPLSTVAQLERISEAAATVQYCETLGSYLAAGLEKYFGVPEVKAPAPFGLKASDELLREIGRLFNKEAEVETVIVKERGKIAADLERLRNRLTGKKVYIAAGGPLAYSIIALVKDLGMDVVGTSVWHHDQKYDNDDDRLNFLNFAAETYGNFSVGVCNKQAFEVTNAINKYKPDIAITRHIETVWAAKLGIPSIFAGNHPTEMLYDGLIRFGQTIDDAIANPAYIKNVAKHSKLPYTNWWLEQNTYSFLGGEKND